MAGMGLMARLRTDRIPAPTLAAGRFFQGVAAGSGKLLGLVGGFDQFFHDLILLRFPGRRREHRDP